MNSQPSVTFIIANHNYEAYLGDAIQSALAQTHKNVNVCVIDDSSKDVDAVERVIKQNLFPKGVSDEDMTDNRRTWSDGKHSAIFLSDGPYKQAYARNVGIQAYLNQTDFFAILDADDMVHPRKIEMMLQPMLLHQAIGATYADYTTINDENDMKCREFKEPYDFFRLQAECIVHSGALIRKLALLEVMENGQFFDIELPPVEDYDMWIRLSEKFLFVHIPESLTTVRVHRNNSTNTTTHDFRVERLRRIFEKAAARRNIHIQR